MVNNHPLLFSPRALASLTFLPSPATQANWGKAIIREAVIIRGYTVTQFLIVCFGFPIKVPATTTATATKTSKKCFFFYPCPKTESVFTGYNCGFFVHFFAVTSLLHRKSSQFYILWRRRHMTTTIFFFSLTLMLSFSIQLHKICWHFANQRRCIYRKKVCDSTNWLFKWRSWPWSSPSLLLELPLDGKTKH